MAMGRGAVVAIETPEIDTEKCTGCGQCVVHCPAGAVTVVDGKPVISAPEKCTYCADCEETCPLSAIRCGFEICYEADAA